MFIHTIIMAINVNNHVVIKYLKMSEPVISFNTFSMSYLNRIIDGVVVPVQYVCTKIIIVQ